MNDLRDLLFARRKARAVAARRRRRVTLFGDFDPLEGRVTPAHLGATQPLTAAFSGPLASPGTGTGIGIGGRSSSSSNSTLTTALQTLKAEVQTIELGSGTTVGQLAAIRAAFQTLQSDGLTPSSQTALTSFENSLVTSYASGTTLTGNSTLLAQFEALYTSSPTSQQTTDLTTAYNALASAVTSSNITSADITAIDTDYAAVLSAEGSTGTATYPYFTLVTGGGPGGGGFGGGC